MAKPHFKDVTINGREFRISAVPALDGTWIIAQMGLRAYGDPEVYRRIQDCLFGAISVLRDVGGERVPMKIYEGGRWLVPDLELEYDLVAVQELYTEALEFNVGPFFTRMGFASASTTPATNQ